MNNQAKVEQALDGHPLRALLLAVAQFESSYQDKPAKVIAHGNTVRGYWQLHTDVVADADKAGVTDADRWSLEWQRDVAAWYLGEELPRILVHRVPQVWSFVHEVPVPWVVWAYVAGPARVSPHAMRHRGNIVAALRATGPGLEHSPNKTRYLARVLGLWLSLLPERGGDDDPTGPARDGALGVLMALLAVAVAVLMLL